MTVVIHTPPQGQFLPISWAPHSYRCFICQGLRVKCVPGLDGIYAIIIMRKCLGSNDEGALLIHRLVEGRE